MSGAPTANANGNQSNQQIEHKKMFHPFADKPSPIEEWKQVILLALETMLQFIFWDILGNALKFTTNTIGLLLLTPMLLLGLLGESLRRLKNKVSF